MKIGPVVEHLLSTAGMVEDKDWTNKARTAALISQRVKCEVATMDISRQAAALEEKSGGRRRAPTSHMAARKVSLED